MAVKLTIIGAPRTKKTSNRIIVTRGRRPRRIIMPSRAWEDWANDAVKLIMVQTKLERIETPLPKRAYNCAAIFYRDARRGDAVGYYQGLADVLEKAQVITDDKFITQWDGSRLEVDHENPRVELILTEVAA